MRNIPLWTNHYIGIPWLETGRDQHKGLDCWGLVRLVLWDRVGLDLPELATTAWTHEGDSRKLLREIKEYTECVPGWHPVQEPVQAYDLIWLKNPWPIHFGVVVADGWFLHVEKGCDATVESYRSMRWGKRIQGFFRHDSQFADMS